MEWELYERYRATALLVVVILFSALLLALQRTRFVQRFRLLLLYPSLPITRLITQMETAPKEVMTKPISPNLFKIPSSQSEQTRALYVLEQENERLHQLLDLKEHFWPEAKAAHIIGRDPQRWFQELVLDKGSADGIGLDNPVIATTGSQSVLVGRTTQVEAHVCRVMLIQDSLSAVAATIADVDGEDGIVEGTNGHDLEFKFLSRGSKIKIGDLIVTSGLGGVFPAGIPLGWVGDIYPDPRQLFLQARLIPAFRGNALRLLLVLTVTPPAKAPL